MTAVRNIAMGECSGGVVPRTPWGRRCRAHSSQTGLPCGAWAVRGADVCQAHGGAAPQVRDDARLEMTTRLLKRGMDDVVARYERAREKFQAERVVTVSRLLGIPPEQVGWAEVVWCHVEHGVPPLEHEGPQIGDFPMDGRIRRAIERGGPR